MSDPTEKLQQQLQAAQRALAEAQARGERHDAEHQAVTKEMEDNRSALLFMLEDLEAARKQIEHSHQEWMAALDVLDDPIFLHDKDFHILRCNKAYQQRAGMAFHDIIGKLYYEVFPKNAGPLPCCLHAMEKVEEEEELTVGEVTYRSRVFSIHDEQGGYLYSVHTLEDITEHKRMIASVIESEELFRVLYESSRDAIMLVSTEQEFLSGNPAALMLFGCRDEQEFAALSLAAISPEFQPDGRRSDDKIQEIMRLVLTKGSCFFEWLQRRMDGTTFPVEVLLTATTIAGKPVIQASVRDITERKRAEKILLESEEKFRKITETAQDGIIMMGADQRISFWNLAAERIFGYTTGEALGQELHALITTPAAQTAFAQGFRHFVESGEGPVIGKLIEVSALHRGGGEFPVELSISAAQLNGQWHAIGIVRDITARKQAELTIQHANRALAALSAVNRTLVRATSEEELLRSICQAIVEQRGYKMAWVGYAQHDEAKTIKVMAHAGGDERYCLQTILLTWAEGELGMRPSSVAIHSGVTQVSQDIANDPSYLPWRELMQKCGFASCIALPLLNGNNTVLGTMTVYADEVNAFSPGEINLLEEMADDLAFGVRTLHTRHERDFMLEKNQQQLAQLQDSLEDTVRAIATIGEMRDPYTAGHQVRVADLAAAIGTQMGLPNEQVHAIHLAGVVHDLGKIQVPAEILSKPGKITDIEFSLIKIHPLAGYDILKGIDFPWPIAQMVLQHHERLDGSGYPQGLRGDTILLEARILCVADVVEAMSSHRPYRPGLGLDAALDEITRSRGIYYDPQVVDACLVLFREQQYSLKN